MPVRRRFASGSLWRSGVLTMLAVMSGHPTAGQANTPVPAPTKNAAVAGSADGDIAVVVNPSLRAVRFDLAKLEAIFTTTARNGPDGKPIIVFNSPPDDKLRIEFDRVVLRMTPDQVSRHWIDQRIRNGQRPPRQIGDPALILRLVGKLPSSIGYVPRRLVDSTVVVVAFIHEGKVVTP
jgi:hypothetical protein